MILVLGGTTEGREVVQALEEAGKPFYYSTKGSEQDVPLHHGIRLTGGMDKEQMERFCTAQGIRLLVDAAHPFAEQLHEVVRQVSEGLQLPVIRFERIYPEYQADAGLTWCEDFTDAVQQIKASDITKLLALTGVQTMGKLAELWQSGMDCYFRILNRDSSREIACRHGFPADRLCYYHAGNETDCIRRISPEAILLKESGISGGFCQKVDAARALGIQVFVVRRPVLPASFIQVDGPHGLRRCVERLLPEFYPLHSGLTTGTCATAAAVAATYRLCGNTASDVPVRLPDGETIAVTVMPGREPGEATVIKEAGDDPDITNGAQVCASIRKTQEGECGYQILIRGGAGIGIVTLPGLGLEVGGPAINAVPRQMIQENVSRALSTLHAPAGEYTVTISVPDGERLAERTFNPRLGVVGGISIIGTSGIVKPFSSEAFVQSIRKSLEVAQASGSPLVVINSGAKSERILRAHYPTLPPQAFVHYGNFIGETLEAAAALHIPRMVMGVMLGKAVKLAEGHLDTHSKHTVMNKDFIRQVAADCGCPPSVLARIDRITLARELWEILPAESLSTFTRKLLNLCHCHCAPLLPEGKLTVILISENGNVFTATDRNQ